MEKANSQKMSQGLRKRIRQGLEYAVAQSAGVVAEGIFENPLLSSAVASGVYAVESQIDELLFPDYPPPNITMPSTKMVIRKPARGKQTRKVYRRPARVPRLLNRTAVEVKHFDTYVTNSLDTIQTFKFTSMPCVPLQGTDYNNRVGRKIKIIGLHVQCEFAVSAPAQVYLTGDTIKCDFFRDNQTQGALAATTKVYDVGALGGAVFQCERVVETMKRFNRLYSGYHNVVVQTITGTAVTTTANVPIMELNLKLNDIVEFQGNAGTIADVVNKSYFMSCSHLQANVATAAYSVAFYARFRFIDY